MEKRYYGAYGSNLNIRQMKIRCPNAKIIGTSVIEGSQLLFKGSRTGYYLTVEPKENCRVPIAVWEVTQSDELSLDRYEGFPSFYYKKDMVLPVKVIKTGKVRSRKVFLYVMHENRPIGKPSSLYLRTCFEGYRNFGFDNKPLINACLNCGGSV